VPGWGRVLWEAYQLSWNDLCRENENAFTCAFCKEVNRKKEIKLKNDHLRRTFFYVFADCHRYNTTKTPKWLCHTFVKFLCEKNIDSIKQNIYKKWITEPDEYYQKELIPREYNNGERRKQPKRKLIGGPPRSTPTRKKKRRKRLIPVQIQRTATTATKAQSKSPPKPPANQAVQKKVINKSPFDDKKGSIQERFDAILKSLPVPSILKKYGTLLSS